MKRTQIQLPDWLFMAAGKVAAEKEISLAELVRRGLEYMVSVTPESTRSNGKWKIPSSCNLGSSDPFTSPDWRERLHSTQLMVAEEGDDYSAGDSE